MYKICQYAVTTLVAVFVCMGAAAQRLDAGLFNSPKGFGAAFHFPDQSRQNRFVSLALYSDITGMLDGKVKSPGVKLEFSYNIVYMRFGEDERCSLYIGAGACTGYLVDKVTEPHGFMLGLNCSNGLMVKFARGVTLDLSFNFGAGLHLRHSISDDSSTLSIYRNGIMQCWYPQLSIFKSF